MKKIKIVLDFLKLTVSQKIEFYKNVYNKMNGNTMFATPDVPNAQVNTATLTLETDYTASLGGGHALVAKMHQSEKACDDLMRKQANYVDRIANGNEAIILSAGFHVSKQPSPKQKPDFLVEANGEHGVIKLSRKSIPGAVSYVWQYSPGALPVDDKGWLFGGASTKSTFSIAQLETATRCWFRVAGVTKEGLTAWSEPVMKVVP
jgi:hypothetical protein